MGASALPTPAPNGSGFRGDGDLGVVREGLRRCPGRFSSLVLLCPLPPLLRQAPGVKRQLHPSGIQASLVASLTSGLPKR